MPLGFSFAAFLCAFCIIDLGQIKPGHQGYSSYFVHTIVPSGKLLIPERQPWPPHPRGFDISGFEEIVSKNYFRGLKEQNPQCRDSMGISLESICGSREMTFGLKGQRVACIDMAHGNNAPSHPTQEISQKLPSSSESLG
eukprot:338954-Amorphochlora_amoeboformis.AAC.1